MRSAAISCLAVLLASVTMSAQRESQTSSPSGQIVLVQPPPTVGTCPLGMHVRQGVNGQLLEVKGDRRMGSFAAKLILTLTGPALGQGETTFKVPAMANSLQIKEAAVTVHGWNGKGRIVRARSGALKQDQEDSHELTKTFTIRFAAPDVNEISSEFLVSGLTSWTSVDLNSVTYADGETWTFSGSASCHAVPDPLMLISAR
jgi:hypothetical protein